MVTGVVCFALSGCQVFGFTNYEVFGVVEEFGPGYVLGFPKLLRCPLRCCWVGELENWKIEKLKAVLGLGV